jgi:hypothetical protein
MDKCRKGSALILIIFIMIIACVVLSLMVKFAWFLTVAPVIKNIIPFVIGIGIGYFFGQKSKKS